jgi:prevent-host-death family protein
MRKASIRDLRIHTSKLIREAEEGDIIIIERRGQPVAEIRPITPQKQPPLPDMTDIWNRYPAIPADSTDHISEDRDR